jgi:hypothetical protein
MRKTGKAQPIRPNRRRTVPTIKFAGLTLTPECAARVREYADKLGLALGGAISEIVEGWMKNEEELAEALKAGELAEALKAGDDRP